MFPLKVRTLIRGCQAHIRAGLGCGLDVVAKVGTPLYAPFDGTLETYFGQQGGNWARIVRSNGDQIEMAHLAGYELRAGQVKAGTIIASTGNTGAITTGPHLHIQIIRDGKRLDPDSYNWEDSVIIHPMKCETEKKEIMSLNFEIGTVTTERDYFRTQLKVEEEGHRQTFKQLETSRAEVTKLERETKENKSKIDQIKGIVL